MKPFLFILICLFFLVRIIIFYYFINVLTRDAFTIAKGGKVRSTMGWWRRLMVLSLIWAGLQAITSMAPGSSAGTLAQLMGIFGLPIVALPFAGCAWIIGGGLRSRRSNPDSPPQPQESSVGSPPGILGEGELEEFWHVSDGDQELGAMTTAQIHTFLRLNKVSRDAFVYRQEHGRWMTLEEAGFCQ